MHLFCLISRTVFYIGQLRDFAKFGCFVDFDLFSQETPHYLQADFDFPSDAQRMTSIRALVEADFEDQVTLGHDIYTKHRLVRNQMSYTLILEICM